MRKSLLAIIFLFSGVLQAQTISFTFDDGLDPRIQPRAEAWNTELLEALANAKVKSMLFPVGKTVDSPTGMRLVEAWAAHGHAVGNHTYSHGNLGSDQVSLESFKADVLKADRLLGGVPGWTQRLRFPYLKEGDTVAKRDGMRAWMREQAYLPAPISIDTSDWYYNRRFLAWRAEHPDDDTAPFRDLYLAHLWDRAEYYEHLSRDVLGRSPAHVMLLHVNHVNATFLPDVLAMFRAKGWKIVSPDEAFTDTLYSGTTATLPAGESVVWALANQAGYSGLRYPAEDGVYEEAAVNARGL